MSLEIFIKLDILCLWKKVPIIWYPFTIPTFSDRWTAGRGRPVRVRLLLISISSRQWR